MLPSLVRYGDQNSMRFSVESKVLFLTLDMASLLLSLPEEYLISSRGETKHVFRAAMREIVPDEILDRRDKIGFATPERQRVIALAYQAREWLQHDGQVPLLSQRKVLTSFHRILEGKEKFSWQAWRWINFSRWYGHFMR